jgi:endoglucanase
LEKISLLLKRLSEAFGPSGYENEVVDLLGEELKEVCETRRLSSNSLLAILKGNKKGKVLFSAHLDEIGIMISKIENGYARIVPIGGVDPKILPSQRVKIRTSKGFQHGVIGMLAPHLQKGEKKDVTFDSLFLDLSCAPDAKVGDVCVVDAEATRIGENHFSGKAMDDRASVAALVTAVKTLAKIEERPNVYALFSSREEVGTIGALTGAFEVKPDIGIAIDVTFADNSASNAPEINLGQGPALSVGAGTYKKIYDVMVEVAKDENVKYQIEPNPGRTGTDADAIQLSYKGVPVMLISIPEMYMHTPVEVIDLNDVWSTSRLLSAFAIKWGEKSAS